MNTLDALAASSLAKFTGASETRAPDTLSVFELNRVFRLAKEQELDCTAVTLGQLKELFAAASTPLLWDSLDSSIRELRRRLAGNNSNQSDIVLTLSDVLIFFCLICPWNSVDQVASLAITTGKVAAGANALSVSKVASVLRLGGVSSQQIQDYVESNSSPAVVNDGSIPSMVDEESNAVVKETTLEASQESSSNKTSSAPVAEEQVVDYDSLLTLLHEYEVFQEHTITHAKLKR